MATQSQDSKTTHFKVTRYMLEAGIKLKMKSVSVATAAFIYHTFFNRCPLDKYDPHLIGLTSLYLAGKVEEDHVKMRDVINVCHRMLNKYKAPLDIGATYWSLRETVANTELLILRVLQFKVSFVHPHKFLLHYLKSLENWLEPSVVEKFPIAETSWAMLRDCYHGDICLRYKPEHLAVSALYLALQTHGVDVPHSRQAEFKWWEALVDDISLGQIRDIVSDMIDIYNMENATST